MKCPVANCVIDVAGPLRVCRGHYALIPRPQQDALNHYARTRKGGPAHEASFDRAVDSIEKMIESRKPIQRAALPYRDD